MSLMNASSSARRACSASGSARSRPAQSTGTFVVKSHPTEHALKETLTSKSQNETRNRAPNTPRGSADRPLFETRLPPITSSKAPQRSSIKGTSLWDKVCVPELLHSEKPDLTKLRLYFKGLNLRPEQINRAHPETKWTFLHHFAFQGDVDLVSWGLQAGADPSAANAMGKTPLHLAAEVNNAMVVLALLRGGADVNATTLSGYTPLHLAVLNRNKLTAHALLTNLLQPPDLYAESIHGTPLEMAKDPEIREMLREYALHGFLKSPKSKRKLRLSSSLSRSREFSENGSAAPTPKNMGILLQPLLVRDISGQSGKVPKDMSSADCQQLKAIERQILGLKSV